MHGRPALRHETSDHSRRGFILEELTRNLTHRLVGGALAHADEDDAFANRHDISAFHSGVLEILIGVAPPDLEFSTLESRMKLVDGSLQQRLRPTGRPEHGIASYAIIDPTRRISLKQGVGNWRQHKVGHTKCIA